MLCLVPLIILFVTKVAYGRPNINITYVYMNQPPYEEIINNTWQFECCTKDVKSLFGVISRSINYISAKHCPHFKFHPHRVDSINDVEKIMLKAENSSVLNRHGFKGEHFIFGPLSMSAHLYYKLQYNPKRVTLQTNFIESPGIITVQRRADVDLTFRILKAIKKSSVIIIFFALCLPTIAVSLWVVDRKSLEPSHNPFQCFFNNMYFSIVTLTTVGYGDIVPSTSLGKVRVVVLCYL